MGMANKAPMDTYTRTRYVSEHAILRLRERIGDKHSLSHRPDDDLGNALDEAVKQSKFMFVPRGDQKIINISERFGFPLRAVIGKDKHNPKREAIITIMIDDAAYANGPGAAPPSMGDLLSTEAHERLRAALPEKRAAVLTQKPQEFATHVVPVDLRLLVIGGQENESVLAEGLQQRLLALHNQGVNLDNVMVWKPVFIKLSVAVSMEES